VTSRLSLGLVASVALLAGCEPSDAEYVAVARPRIADNCVDISNKGGCVRYPFLEGAHVTRSEVGGGSAATGRSVTVGVDGPRGPATCMFTIGRTGRALEIGSGRCEAK
jgi:hypothetical protein